MIEFDCLIFVCCTRGKKVFDTYFSKMKRKFKNSTEHLKSIEDFGKRSPDNDDVTAYLSRDDVLDHCGLFSHGNKADFGQGGGIFELFKVLHCISYIYTFAGVYAL